MKQIFIETCSADSSEHKFVETLCKLLPIQYSIVNVGGWEKLKTRKMDFGTTDSQNIILFDANSAIEDRRKKINKIVTELGVKGDIFLFPNNKDSGCFETLLENIAVDAIPLGCFDKFTGCLLSKKNENEYHIPNVKAKMYSYISTFEKNISKGEWRFGCSKYWNLDHDYIQPLREFLTKESSE